MIVVAGAGHGIGRAVAEALADAGASLVVSDLGTTIQGEGTDPDAAGETVETIVGDGGTATAHVGDVTDPGDVEAMLDVAVEEYGRVDSVANFAGITRTAPLWEMSLDQWEAVVDVHLRGHFLLLRTFADHWVRTRPDGDRSFLCVSSQATLGLAGEANYAAAKAGVLGLMRTAANELRPHGVRVNALLPSATTRMSQNLSEHPFENEVDPRDVAPMVGYLASEAASDVTGSTLRAGGEEVGVLSRPEYVRLGYRSGGWSVEELAERFERDVAAGVDLDQSETLIERRYGLGPDVE